MEVLSLYPIRPNLRVYLVFGRVFRRKPLTQCLFGAEAGVVGMGVLPPSQSAQLITHYPLA